MILLKIIFCLILIAMLVITIYAQSQCNIFAIPSNVTGHPWFTATLFDAYCGFITFYCWVYFKEKTVLMRVVWFVLIMLLGNIAMSSYVLFQISRLKNKQTPEALLTD
jgi:preprotein translocase subunit SecG